MRVGFECEIYEVDQTSFSPMGSATKFLCFWEVVGILNSVTFQSLGTRKFLKESGIYFKTNIYPHFMQVLQGVFSGLAAQEPTISLPNSAFSHGRLLIQHSENTKLGHLVPRQQFQRRRPTKILRPPSDSWKSLTYFFLPFSPFLLF